MAKGTASTTPAPPQTSHPSQANFVIDIPIFASLPQMQQQTQQQQQTQRQRGTPYPQTRPSQTPSLTFNSPRNQEFPPSSSQARSRDRNSQRPSPTVTSGSRSSTTTASSASNISSSSRPATPRSVRRPVQIPTKHANGQVSSSGNSPQTNATEIASQQQQSTTAQPVNPPINDLLASIGNVEAMLASWESESKDTDEKIRHLYEQEANFRSGIRPSSPVLSASPSSTSSSAPSSSAYQGSSTTATATTSAAIASNSNKTNTGDTLRKKASDGTIASSLAFHNSERARVGVNMFERIPTEVLCVILGWVVEPIGDKMVSTNDGDGPSIGNPLFYWYLDPDRTLLRLVCRSWNHTIVAMARDIHVKLGSDESMARLLEREKRHRTRPATVTRAVALQGRIGGARLPYLSLAIRNAYSQSQLQRSGEQLIPTSQPQQRQPPTLRRSARLSQVTSPSTPLSSPSLLSLASTATRSQATSTEWDPPFSYIHTRHTRDQYERRRLVKQTGVPIQGFYQLQAPCPAAKATTKSSPGFSTLPYTGGETSIKTNPWSFPPSVSSLSVEGGLSRSPDPKEDVTLSPTYAGNSPRPGGGSFDTTSGSPKYRMNDALFGTMLDHWLRAAAPEGLVKFSISNSADFGLNGMLSLPRRLTTLKISRCPRINGGVLHIGFQHLSNLTSLTVCSELLFTDETFLIALKSLSQLRHLVYVYPCDAVQPVWRDLFRYCSSCELYHRRVSNKTYSKTLLMPELPDQIQDFTFELDEPRFQESRIETFEQNRHGLDRRDIRYAITLWKANDTTAAESVVTPPWSGFDLAQGDMRSWWPANLTRLDLSKSIVTGSTLDVPPQLQELVIAYPLEPNEMNGDGSDLSVEEKQWYPKSLSTLDIRGVPYHVFCVLQEETEPKVRAWMAYINKMLRMAPRHLEHLTTSSFQIPDSEAMIAMKYLVQNSLKTWNMRLLCPQRPRLTTFNLMQLYAPFNYVDDESGEEDDEEEMDDEEEAVMTSSEDTDSDSSMEYPGPYLRRGSLAINQRRRRLGVVRALQAQRPARPTLGQTRPLGQSTTAGGRLGGLGGLGGGHGSQASSESALDQYDVTPVMIRHAVKNMKVLESVDIYVNYQHFRHCRASWKGDLSLSEPIPVTPSPRPSSYGNKEEGEHNKEGLHRDLDGDHPRKKLKSILKRSNVFVSNRSSVGLPVDRKGKGRTREDKDLKGKGRKVDYSLEQLWNEAEAGREPLLQDKGKGVKRGRDNGHEHGDDVDGDKLSSPLPGTGGDVRAGGQPRISLRYWNNSCCGQRCLG